VQGMRRRADGILVGAGTVCADDPSLGPRPDGGRRPWRIVADARGRSPLTARVFADERRAQTLAATTVRAPARWRRALAAAGVTVLELPSAPDGGGVDLTALLCALGERGLLRVWCEGGGRLAGALARAGMVDRYYWIVAPTLFGAPATRALDGGGWAFDARPRLRWRETRRLGTDMLLAAEPDGTED